MTFSCIWNSLLNLDLTWTNEDITEELKACQFGLCSVLGTHWVPGTQRRPQGIPDLPQTQINGLSAMERGDNHGTVKPSGNGGQHKGPERWSWAWRERCGYFDHHPQIRSWNPRVAGGTSKWGVMGVALWKLMSPCLCSVSSHSCGWSLGIMSIIRRWDAYFTPARKSLWSKQLSPWTPAPHGSDMAEHGTQEVLRGVGSWCEVILQITAHHSGPRAHVLTHSSAWRVTCVPASTTGQYPRPGC